MTLPRGIIAEWHQPIVDIPAGWTLCDGTNGTPDLRDKFIRGAGGADDPGDIGGNDVHQHTFTGDGHGHDLLGGTMIPLPGGGIVDSITTTDPAVGTTDSGSTIPAYYALAYIMKT